MNLKNLWGIFLILGLVLASSCENDFDDFEQDAIVVSNHESAKRICLSNEHTQSLLEDPDYREKRVLMLSNFEKFSAQFNIKASCAEPTIVPVAIHYQGVSNPNESCLRALAIDQINRLNMDYTGENSDISSWTNQAAAHFSGVSNGEMCVNFVIADQNHPSGYGLANGDLAITINRTQGDQVNNWAGYINIFVQPNTGFLGYAPLGGSGNGDGVVIDASAFGSGQGCGNVSPEAPYDLGRTLTHEMGHYLLLDHIWGNGCGVDDEVNDTPDQASDYGGCPNLGASSCGSTDMHMNYMDYTNDACMYMFSAGQDSRMTNFLLSNLNAVISNASNVYSGGGGTGGSCSSPSGLTVNVQGENTAQVSWNAAASATQYNVRYRVSGTSSYQNQSIGTTSITLSSLQAGTTYEVGVQTVCGATTSSFSSNQTFTTTGNSGGGGDICEAPTAPIVKERSASSVLVDWENITGAIRYNIRYRLTGTNSWARKGASKSKKVLKNLQPAAYEYQLRTKCADGWTGWSQKFGFDLGTGGGSGDNSVKIVVTLDEYGSETTWELYDNTNQLLASDGPFQDGQSGTQKTKTIDLPDGCYEIDLYDDFGDGICCDYGNGKFEVLNSNDAILASSDGIFGSYELISFCITNGSARITKRVKDPKKLNRGKKKKSASDF